MQSLSSGIAFVRELAIAFSRGSPAGADVVMIAVLWAIPAPAHNCSGAWVRLGASPPASGQSAEVAIPRIYSMLPCCANPARANLIPFEASNCIFSLLIDDH